MLHEWSYHLNSAERQWRDACLQLQCGSLDSQDNGLTVQIGWSNGIIKLQVRLVPISTISSLLSYPCEQQGMLQKRGTADSGRIVLTSAQLHSHTAPEILRKTSPCRDSETPPDKFLEKNMSRNQFLEFHTMEWKSITNWIFIQWHPMRRPCMSISAERFQRCTEEVQMRWPAGRCHDRIHFEAAARHMSWGVKLAFEEEVLMVLGSSKPEDELLDRFSDVWVKTKQTYYRGFRVDVFRPLLLLERGSRTRSRPRRFLVLTNMALAGLPQPMMKWCHLISTAVKISHEMLHIVEMDKNNICMYT